MAIWEPILDFTDPSYFIVRITDSQPSSSVCSTSLPVKSEINTHKEEAAEDRLIDTLSNFK